MSQTVSSLFEMISNREQQYVFLCENSTPNINRKIYSPARYMSGTSYRGQEYQLQACNSSLFRIFPTQHNCLCHILWKRKQFNYVAYQYLRKTRMRIIKSFFSQLMCWVTSNFILLCQAMGDLPNDSISSDTSVKNATTENQNKQFSREKSSEQAVQEQSKVQKK